MGEMPEVNESRTILNVGIIGLGEIAQVSQSPIHLFYSLQTMLISPHRYLTSMF